MLDNIRSWSLYYILKNSDHLPNLWEYQKDLSETGQKNPLLLDVGKIYEKSFRKSYKYIFIVLKILVFLPTKEQDVE